MNKHDRMYIAIANNGNALIEFFNLPNQDPVVLSKKLFRLEYKAHGLAEDYCNGKIETEDWEGISDKILASLEKIIGKKNMNKVFFNGDPRGYALKIYDKYRDKIYKAGITSDFGGYGIIAPDFRE